MKSLTSSFLMPAVMVAVATFALNGRALSAPDYAAMRTHWVNMLTGTANGGLAVDYNDTDIKVRLSNIRGTCNSNWTSMEKNPTSYLWSNLPGTDIGTTESAYERLWRMSLAWATSGQEFYQNAALQDDIIMGLNWMNQNRYNKTSEYVGSWYRWEISVPRILGNILVIHYDHMSAHHKSELKEQIRAINRFCPKATISPAYYIPSIYGTSQGYLYDAANGIWRARVRALVGMMTQQDTSEFQDETFYAGPTNFTNDPSGPDSYSTDIANDLSHVRSVLDNQSAIVTSGEGMYVDGTYIAHAAHPYNGGYGLAWMGTSVELLALLNGPGSDWAMTPSDGSNFTTFCEGVFKAFEPIVYKGDMLDMFRGREVSRSSNQDNNAGMSTMRNLARMVEVPHVTPAYVQSYKSMIRRWATAGNPGVVLNASSGVYWGQPLGMIMRMKECISNAQITTEPVGNYRFVRGDRMLHRRDNYMHAIAMFSTRVNNYEYGNGENKRGFFLGTGATYLYNDDHVHYNDAHWPTIDPLRIPGTTVHNRQRSEGADRNMRSTKNTVGMTGNDHYGVACMELSDPISKTQYSELTGRKAWFMFDDEIVCIGTGISNGSDTATVETIVENRKISPTATAATSANTTINSTTTALPATSWAYLDSNGEANKSIGYYFPDNSTNLRAKHQEARTGSWRDINDGGSTATLNANFFTLWFDHGSNPSGATSMYKYVLLPNKTQAEVAAYAANPDIEILRADAQGICVREHVANVTGFVSWNDALTSGDFITVNKKACVLVDESEQDYISVAISDPTQANTGTIQVTLAGKKGLGGVIADGTDPEVTVTSLNPITFSVNVNGSMGRTYNVSFHSPANVDPLADAQSVTTPQDVAKAITLTGSDPDDAPLAFAIVTQPSNGTLTGTPPAVTYTPAPGYLGSDAFTFKVNNGTVDSPPATVSIEVTPPPIGWTAYHDVSHSGSQLTHHITTFGLDQSGELINYETATPLGVTLQIINNPAAPAKAGGSGGPMPDAGTDAHNTFAGIVSFTNIIYYGEQGWWVDAVFTGLDPSRRYEFATSCNRGRADYGDRWSKFTILDIDEATGASTPGVTVFSPTSVAFRSGNNTANGHVARWTEIRPGANGSFRVRVEAGDGPGMHVRNGYAFDGILLRDLGPAEEGAYHDDLINQDLTVASGASLTIGSGASNFMHVSVGETTAPPHTVDASLAASVAIHVGDLFVGVRTNTTTASDQVVAPAGNLYLGANNHLTANRIFIGSEGRVGTSSLTTAAASTTLIRTPDMRVGATIRNTGANFTTGSGSTLTVQGIDGGRTALIVGEERYASGGIAWSATGTMNLSASQATLKLSSLAVGRSLFAASENGTASGTLTMSGNTANQLDISGTGSVVQVGTSAGNQTTGTMTIGNLGPNSIITSTNNATAILIGNRSTATGDAVSGTVNLNGGTATITTTGAAIAGGSNATSTLNLSGGVTLKAGASSSDWIRNLNTAAIGSGGATIDTNAFNLGISQGFSGAGNLTKTGAGTLTLSGVNTYTSNTTVAAGALVLADNAGLTFAVTDTASNRITGAGAVTMEGDFTINTTAVTVETGSWVLVDAATKSFTSTFSVNGWTKSGNVWTLVDGDDTWKFSEATGTLTLNDGGPPVSDYAAWAAQYPDADLSDPNADFDGDGLSNFYEFAFGLDPTSGSSVNPIADINELQSEGIFRYTRRADSGLSYTYWISTDLQDWGIEPATVLAAVPGEIDDDGVQTVAVVLDLPESNKLFLRVMVE